MQQLNLAICSVGQSSVHCSYTLSNVAENTNLTLQNAKMCLQEYVPYVDLYFTINMVVTIIKQHC